MINDLPELKQKDLLFYTKLTVIVKYLPKIMNKMIKDNPNKDVKDIAIDLLKESIVNLKDKSKEKIYIILKSSVEKGMSYKTYKKLIEIKLKRKKEENKLFNDNDKIEDFFVKNKLISETFNKLKEDSLINEEIKNDTRIAINNYIGNMLSKEEIKLVRRKKWKKGNLSLYQAHQE